MTMDDAMTKLETAVEAVKAKAAADAVAGVPNTEEADAERISAFADTINPPAPVEG